MSDLESFLSYFPEIVPPITLTEDSIDHINATNDPLPFYLVNKFIESWEVIDESESEFIEYVPCLKLPKLNKFHSLIYWKAGLLKYDFILANIDETGQLIQRKTLCGTIVENELIKKSVANIDEDYIIHIVAGAHKTTEIGYDASYSQTFSMEIMANGEIVVSH
jgi:hypothetical protein